MHARGWDWVVLPSDRPNVLLLRPLTGGDDDVTGIFLPLEGRDVRPAQFREPDPEAAGDAAGAILLCDAARLSIRNGAAPFRSLGRIAASVSVRAPDHGAAATELEADGWRLEGNVFVRGDGLYLPLYEAKMIHQFDHHFGGFECFSTRPSLGSELLEPSVSARREAGLVRLPWYEVPERAVQQRTAHSGATQGWFLASA